MLCHDLISNDTKQIIIFFIGEDTDIGAFSSDLRCVPLRRSYIRRIVSNHLIKMATINSPQTPNFRASMSDRSRADLRKKREHIRFPFVVDEN